MSRENPSEPRRSATPDGAGLPSHHRHPHRLHAPLDVVAVVSNPVRYRSRFDLFRAFERYVTHAGCRLTVVELAYGHRAFEVTEEENPRHLQLRTGHELWHKENLVNLGIQRLPRDWEYVAWLDADIRFANPDWVQETLQELQHYQVVQMFAQAQDLGPRHEPLKLHNGYMYSYLSGLSPGKDYGTWHPGYAWAARREAVENVGGLMEFPILGSADRHMAAALVGSAGGTLNRKLHPNYKRLVLDWQERAELFLRRNVGYVPGLLLHHWHGRKVDRRYVDRWQILIDDQFDPLKDLKKDWQGVLQLSHHNRKLRDDIRAYFRSRNEDSITVD